MVAVNLVSAIAMGLVLLGIVVAITRGRQWHSAPAGAGDGPTIGDAANDPVTWSVAFVAVALGIVIVTVGYVGGTLPMLPGGLAGTLLFGGLAVLLALFLGVGVYAAAKSRGFATSQAAAAGSITLGTLVLTVIVFRLLTA